MLLKRAARIAGAALMVAAAQATATGDSESPAETQFSGSEEAGTGSAAFRIGYYDNPDNGDGNPFLDEALTVIEPVFMADYNVTSRLSAWAELAYDNVSSASIKRLSEFHNQSGASGDKYYGVDAGLHYQLDEDRRIGGFFSASTEYDYTSFGLGGDFSQDFAHKDATVKLAWNGFYDRLDVIRFDGRSEGRDTRVSLSTTLSWYQIITPRMYSDVGATFGYQNGFLETAYNAVVIEDPADPRNPHLDNLARGTEVVETLPNNRLRGSLFGRTRYSLRPGTALELGGRFYLDSWDIFGFTLEPRAYQQITDTLRMRIGYRYYTQTAASYYDDHFTSAPGRRTQDSDLADFDSHGIHGGLLWKPFDDLGLDVSAGYTFRSDGIDQLMLSFGIRKDF